MARPVTPENITKRKFWFGDRRLSFTEVIVAPGATRRWESRIERQVDPNAVRVRLMHSRTGKTNWVCIVYVELWPTGENDAGPDIARIAVTRGFADARDAVSDAERLSVQVFTQLGDALGYEVEQ